MSTTPDLPESGFELVQIYTLELSSLWNKAADVTEKDNLFSFGWDWRMTGTKDVFEVRLSIRVSPSVVRPEQLAVRLVGRFRMVGSPSLGVEQFAKLQAVAILMPYLRQALSAVTTNSPKGPYYLPSINVSTLMERFDVAKASGAKQLADSERPQVKRKVRGRRSGSGRSSKSA
jgi:preprotein translocase subunit SecB